MGRGFALLFTLAIVFLFARPALSDTPLSDPALARAAGLQSSPASATDGRDFVLVWADTRGGGSTIYATRVAADGAVLDPEGIAVSDDRDFASAPAVAWTGNAYIIVWKSEAGCVFRMMRRDGTFFGGISAPIFDWSVSHPRVAGGGGAAMIAAFRPFSHIAVAVIDPIGRVMSVGNVPGRDRFDVACAQRECLLAWQDYESSILGMRVATSGDRLDAEPRTLATDAADPSVAASGDRFLLAWREPAGAAQRLWARELDSAPFLIDEAPSIFASAAAASGRGFVVAWSRNGASLRGAAGERILPTQVRVRRVLDGRDEELSVLRAHAATFTSLTIASNGTTHLGAWIDGDAYSGRIAAAVSRADRSMNRLPVARSAALQRDPAVVTCGDHVLVTWSEDVRRDGIESVFARRFDFLGNPLDARPIAVASSSSSQQHPAAACDGQSYLIGWFEDGRIAARLFARDGTPASEVIGVSADGNSLAIAALDRGFAILSSDRKRLVLTRIAPDATVSSQIIAEHFDLTEVALRWTGSQLVAAWTYANGGRTFAARFTPDGVRLDHDPILVGFSSTLVESPSMACSEAECVIAWWALTEGVKRARLIGGTVFEIGEPFHDISEYRPPSTDRFGPTVLNAGAGFHVVASSRTGTYFGRAVHDGIAAPETLIFQMPLQRIADTALAATPAGMLIVYPQPAHTARSGGAQRLFLRVLGAPE
jgi:hypothetical protein